MYRVIMQKSDGQQVLEHLVNLRNAYRICVPEDQAHWHIKMWPAFLAELNSTAVPGAAILVSYNDTADHEGVTTAYYIQCIPLGPNTPVSILQMPLL